MGALVNGPDRTKVEAQFCAHAEASGFRPSKLTNRPRFALLAVLAFLICCASSTFAQQKVTPADFSLVLTGDSIIESPATVHQSEPNFMALVKDVREGDAAFTNLEESYPARDTHPAATSGGTWMAADPSVVKELQWMGFNLFAAVTVHSFDFGMQGILDTMKTLRDDNAVYAGIGETLGDARAPAYLSTAHGRVALIACTSAFLSSAPAGDPRPDMQGHPGVNPLHFQTIYNVDAATFESLRKLKSDLQLGGGGSNTANSQVLTFPSGASLNGFTSAVFHQSDKTGVETKVDPADSTAIYRSIQEGHRMADYVVADINAFEGMPGPDGSSQPAQYLQEFAHGAIDAGADVMAGTGFHELRGIEIYKGKVIFYSLGDLWTQDNLVRTQPSEFYRSYNLGPDASPGQAYDTRGWDATRLPLWYQSVVAKVVFHDGRPAQVILTPITMSTAPRADAGVPYLADEPAANQILTRLQKLSQPFGTNIVIHNGVGTITISQQY